MNTEAQRIAIAEACGWTFDDGRVINSSGHEWKMLGMSAVPRYLTDLNAMHEAEKVLKGNKFVDYIRRLHQDVFNSDPESLTNGELWELIHATAAQRAEAFLRTLNLWDDNK